MFYNPVRYFAHWLGRRKLPKELAAGDVCSTLSGEGDYVITKVLARDPGIIHVRIYKKRFGYRPERINTALLTLGTVHDEEGCGMGTYLWQKECMVAGNQS